MGWIHTSCEKNTVGSGRGVLTIQETRVQQEFDDDGRPVQTLIQVQKNLLACGDLHTEKIIECQKSHNLVCSNCAVACEECGKMLWKRYAKQFKGQWFCKKHWFFRSTLRLFFLGGK